MDWIPIIISSLSLIISFVVSWNGWWRSRPSLKLSQPNEAAGTTYLRSFDGGLKVEPYRRKEPIPKFQSALFVEVILTNNSTYPLSILEFSIPNFLPFDSSAQAKEEYNITLNQKQLVTIDNRNQSFESLKPEFTIDPFTSKRGYLFFETALKKELNVDKDVPLKVLTSRKEFNFKIKVPNKFDSIRTRTWNNTSQKWEDSTN